MANLNCKCGGRFKTIDCHKPVLYQGRTIYETFRAKAGHASWMCDTCDKLQQQKLRVPVLIKLNEVGHNALSTR